MSDEIEKEIVYEFDTCIPKDSYIKPLYGKISRKHKILHRVLTLLMMGEAIALIILDHSEFRFLWITVLFLIFFFGVLGRILQRDNAKRQYEKIHAAKEDCYTYTFYNDCVKIKNPTVKVTLNYDTAEFYTENNERLMIVFPFDRAINIQKSQYNEEQLAFFKGIVPEKNQKKTEKETAKKCFVISALLVLYTVLLAVIIAVRVTTNARAYYPEYLETTYVSFEACLYEGTIKDIVIINKKYIEYTFIGYGEDERYYTVYSGDDINEFTEELDRLDVNWEFK